MDEEGTVEGESHLIDKRLSVTGIFNKMEALSPSSKMLSSRMRPYWVKKSFEGRATLTVTRAFRLFHTTTHVGISALIEMR